MFHRRFRKVGRSTRRPVGRRQRRVGRSGRRPAHLKGFSKGPSTAHESKIMKDRTFVTLPATLITQAYGEVSAPFTTATSFGMLPFQNAASSPAVQQFVFNTNYGGGTGTGAPAFGQQGMLLPGNVPQLTYGSYYTGLNEYSDAYEQLLPTGFSQWAPFYDSLICHGSSVEVTMTDPVVTGQLCVIPVIGNPGWTSQGSTLPGVQTISPSGGTNDITELLNFLALPDDQPYAKIKLCSSAGGVDKVRIKHKMLTRKLYDKAILRDSDNASLSVANLLGTGSNFGIGSYNNLWSWYIAFIPANPQGHNEVCTIQVKVTYFCEFFDRKSIEYSTALSDPLI